jgi:hypothetical protein
MPEPRLTACIATVRAYLATDEGRREMRRLGLCFGLSYQHALAQKVVALCGVTRYEDITAIVDETMIRELVA